MLRRLLIGFGVFEIVYPKPVIDACERIGLENPDAARLRPGAESIARLEGLIVVWLLREHGRGSRPIRAGLAGVGLIALLVPRPLIRLTQVTAYENASELELKPWVGPAARLLGALYLVVAGLSRRADATEAESSHDAVDGAGDGVGG